MEWPGGRVTRAGLLLDGVAGRAVGRVTRAGLLLDGVAGPAGNQGRVTA